MGFRTEQKYLFPLANPDGFLPAGYLSLLIGRIIEGDCLNDALDNASGQLQNNPEFEETLLAVTSARQLASDKTLTPLPEVVEKTLFRSEIAVDDIDWLILHQANQRIIDAVAKRLKLPAEKVIANLHEYGNTSAASIPLALDEAIKEGKIKAGQTIVTSGFGAGLSWGCAIFRWGKA